MDYGDGAVASDREFAEDARQEAIRSVMGHERHDAAAAAAGRDWVVGIEADVPRPGRHDGTVHGVTYFRCELERGVVVPLKHVVAAAERQPFQ
jgi:hypothetical protein